MSNSQTEPTSTTGSSTSSASPTEILTCGALAAHVRSIAERRGWPVTVRALPAVLHNNPREIKRRVQGAQGIVAYADCGTYGGLDGTNRLPGLHCYDLYAGASVIRRLLDEEPGTYLLTDFLIRSFDRLVIAELGLDRYPELWDDYFGHYKRLVWLAQEPSAELSASAARIAERFGLPLERIDTGLAHLEEALAPLVEGNPL
jgi:hypothetical protein